MAEISVKDTGSEFRLKCSPRSFELFTQVDRSLERARGVGIGLTLVQQLVEMHGGTVEAHSEGLGKGCEFISFDCRSHRKRFKPPRDSVRLGRDNRHATAWRLISDEEYEPKRAVNSAEEASWDAADVFGIRVLSSLEKRS